MIFGEALSVFHSTMKGLILAFALSAIVALASSHQIDLKKVYNEAERKLSSQLRAETIAGSVSSRFNKKKFTSYSREMSDRNAIFKSMFSTLKNEHNLDDATARQLAKRGVSENHVSSRKRGHHSPGGQHDLTPPVTIINDMCEGVSLTCDSSSQFRTISGECNNLNEHYWGAMSTPFLREIEVEEYNPKVDLTVYLDKSSARSLKRGGGGGGGSGGHDGGSGGHDGGSGSGSCPGQSNVPSARTVSKVVHTDTDVPATVTHLLTQWGQFLDHDITLTPENEEHDCCHAEYNATDECFPITVSSTDNFYSGNDVTCLEFTRSVAYCEENGGARQQTQGITSFIDASNVYGSDDDTALALRSLVDGKLLVDENNQLPVINGNVMAGDVRAIEMPGLATMHTLWVREHNRIADLIKAADSSMSDEDIYQNARRIVVAEYQNVVYGQYLPAVLGSQESQSLLPNADGSQYDSSVNPGMTNEFATAAYRFGHSMIQGLIKMYATDNSGQTDEYFLKDNYFNLENYYRDNGQGMEQILMGLLTQPAQAADNQMTDQVTDFLFPEEGASFGQDLVARNIQRGRDHGLPGFCCYYQLYDDANQDCNAGWDKPYRGIPDATWDQLKSVYENPSDIDLFTGAMSQDPWNGGLTGKVFNIMKANQFKRTMDGDRFFFTHQGQAGSFTRSARKTLVERTLSGVICDNTAITSVPSNAFVVTDSSNFISCDQTSSLGDISELLKIGGSK